MQPANNIQSSSCRVGLALGSGSARGCSYIGVIRALEEAGVTKVVLSLSDPVLPKSGLIDGVKIADFVHKCVLDRPIEELPLPLAIIATDLNTGG